MTNVSINYHALLCEFACKYSVHYRHCFPVTLLVFLTTLYCASVSHSWQKAYFSALNHTTIKKMFILFSVMQFSTCQYSIHQDMPLFVLKLSFYINALIRGNSIWHHVCWVLQVSILQHHAMESVYQNKLYSKYRLKYRVAMREHGVIWSTGFKK